MRNYKLNIAGYNILFRSSKGGPELSPGPRFTGYLDEGDDHDIMIRVHSGSCTLPPDAIRVFHAPPAKEVNGNRLKTGNEFWDIHASGHHLYITTSFTENNSAGSAVLQFSLSEKIWDLWIETTGKETDPFSYPLDGLILYYLTVLNRDIMIHASGVNTMGKGFIFTGISGKGKSTMAGLWKMAGAEIIHDDRLIIKKKGDSVRMYNTPVYHEERHCESEVDGIFIIEHGNSNKIIPVTGASAISLILANCIQHNWDHNIINTLMCSVSAVAESVPVARLFFRPDSSVVNQIMEHGQLQ
jgi:hypothetical protein